MVQVHWGSYSARTRPVDDTDPKKSSKRHHGRLEYRIVAYKRVAVHEIS